MVQMPDGFTGGSVTGNSMIDHYKGVAQAAGVGVTNPDQPGFGGMTSSYDQYRQYFSVPDPTPSERGQSWMDRILEGARGSTPPPGIRQPGQGAFPSRWLEAARESVEKRIQESQRESEQEQAREAFTERNQHRRKLEELAKRAMLIGESFLPSELDAIWQQAIDIAEESSRMTGTHVDPWDILEHWAADPEMARNYGATQPSAPPLPEDEADMSPQTSTSTNTVTALTTPEAADAILRRGLHSTLGRKPTDVEFEAFRTYLNDLERDNPQITESTTVFDPETNDTTTESVTTGGAPSPAAAADEFVEGDEFSDEAFAYQMGTQGADIMRQLVGGLV